MAILPRLIAAIDSFTEISGKTTAWLGVLLIILTSLVAILRYGFNFGSIAFQELLIYLHACAFMLGAAYTLKYDQHVRVDIFYRNFSSINKAWVNSIGGLVFLLPLCILVFVSSWDFVVQAWSIKEGSPDPGGIPAVYLLKSLIPLFALLMALQAIAEILRNALVLVETHDSATNNNNHPKHNNKGKQA